MALKGDSSDSDAERRRQAEELERNQLHNSRRQLESILPEETRHMLHELRVHQIELELQNEEVRAAQVKLEVLRARYFELYDLAPLGYCTLDAQGHILQANLAAATLFGATRAALERHPLTQFIFRADQDAYYLQRKQLDEVGEERSFDLRMVKSDGTQFLAHLDATAALDAGGSPILRIGISDVTERRRLQTQCEVQQTVLAHLAGGGVFVETLAALVIGYEKILPGMRGSVLLPDPADRLLRHVVAPNLPPDYCQAIDGIEIGPRANLFGAAAHHRRTTIAADIAKDPFWRDHKALALSQGLQACWAVPIMSVQGMVLGVFAFYFDSPRQAFDSELAAIQHGAHLASIAIERHQSEAALRRSETLSLAILDSVPAEIAVLNGDGTIVAVNENWRKSALEYGPEEAVPGPRTGVGTNYLAACVDDRRPTSELGSRIRGGIQAVLDGRSPDFSLDYPCHLDHEERWFTLNVTPMGATGQGVVVAHTLSLRARFG